jgi:hypothetical protein
MARFHGVVGYNNGQVEKKPGVWVDDIIEVPYFGDVLRNSRQLREGESLNNDLTVQNSISIVADAYANEHFHAIRYVDWAGTLWTVDDVTVQSPRLQLRLGGVYNGPRANGGSP